MLSCTAYSKGQVEKSYHKDNTFGIFTLVFTMQIKESFNILISFHFISSIKISRIENTRKVS